MWSVDRLSHVRRHHMIHLWFPSFNFTLSYKSIDHFHILSFDRLKMYSYVWCQSLKLCRSSSQAQFTSTRRYHFIFDFNSFHFISFHWYWASCLFVRLHSPTYFFMVYTVYWASNTFIFSYACLSMSVFAFVSVEITFTFYSPFIKLLFFSHFVSPISCQAVTDRAALMPMHFAFQWFRYTVANLKSIKITCNGKKEKKRKETNSTIISTK